jgi:hypothetical protein
VSAAMPSHSLRTSLPGIFPQSGTVAGIDPNFHSASLRASSSLQCRMPNAVPAYWQTSAPYANFTASTGLWVHQVAETARSPAATLRRPSGTSLHSAGPPQRSTVTLQDAGIFTTGGRVQLTSALSIGCMPG